MGNVQLELIGLSGIGVGMSVTTKCSGDVWSDTADVRLIWLFITVRVLIKVALSFMSFNTAFKRTQNPPTEEKQPKEEPPRACRLTMEQMQTSLNQLDSKIFTDKRLYELLFSEVKDKDVPGMTVTQLWGHLRDKRIGRAELRAYFKIDGAKFVNKESRTCQRRRESASWDTKPSGSALPDWKKLAEERKITLTDRSKRNLNIGSVRLNKALFSKLKSTNPPQGTSATTLSKYQRYLKALEYDIPLNRSKWTIGHVHSIFNTRKNAFRILKCRSTYLGFVGAFGQEEWTPSESSAFEEPEVAQSLSDYSSSTTNTSEQKPQEVQSGAQQQSGPQTQIEHVLSTIMDRLTLIESRIGEGSGAAFSEPDDSATDSDDASS
jgi:hypothetical protein